MGSGRRWTHICQNQLRRMDFGGGNGVILRIVMHDANIRARTMLFYTDIERSLTIMIIYVSDLCGWAER